MAIDRRQLLKLPAAALAGLAAPGIAVADEPLFLSSVMRPDGSFGAMVIGEDGKRRFDVDLEGRGHDAAVDPLRGLAVVFARRPGTFAAVTDLKRRTVAQIIASPEHRHFFGHGVFTRDGRLLYATENDFSNGRGVLGIYDARSGFARVGEIATGGIGPHEVVLAVGGRQLIVANGGIDTDPASGRDILNPDSMRPSLARIDLGSSGVVELTELGKDFRQLSIRHLVLDAAQNCWFGCQWEGDRLETPPLVGRLTTGSRVELFDAPRAMRHATRNYVGAVASNGGLVAASCPKGGLVLLWDAGRGAFLRAAKLADGCGVAGDGAGILATSGEGEVALLWANGDRRLGRGDVAFDNHLRRILPISA